MRLLPVLILAVAVAALLPPAAADPALLRFSFSAGAPIIPMDERQADRLSAYGLVHALLREGVVVHRVITPPDPLFRTSSHFQVSEAYEGGPFLVWLQDRDRFDAVAAGFPTVTHDRLSEPFIVSRLFSAVEPTDILLVIGYNPARDPSQNPDLRPPYPDPEIDYGATRVLLDRMRIPYDVVNVSAVTRDPNLLFDYDLVVADCPAWHPVDVPSEISRLLRLFVDEGGTLVFTDRALYNLAAVFPGRIAIASSRPWIGDATIHTNDGVLGQYYGDTAVRVATEPASPIPQGAVIASASTNVTVLMDTREYPEGFLGATTYRILAANFTYGNGTVVAFAYHPAEQPAGSYEFTSALYGNVFVRAGPVLLRELPPPPPPSLALPSSSSIGYLFSGFAAVGITDLIRGRIKLRRKEKIAVRV